MWHQGEMRLAGVALRDGEEPGAPPSPCQPHALMRGNESDALLGQKIFCFHVSERHGVRLPMLLCDNSLKRAAGCRRSLIGPDSDKEGTWLTHS